MGVRRAQGLIRTRRPPAEGGSTHDEGGGALVGGLEPVSWGAELPHEFL